MNASRAAAAAALAAATTKAPQGAFLLPALAASPEDDRDIPYVWSGRPVLHRRDWREHDAPVEDQLALGSCTAQTAVGGCEHYDVRAGHYIRGITDLARRWAYERAQQLDGIVGDQGAVLRTALKVVQKEGVPNETTVPYIVTDYGKQLPEHAAIEAAGQKLVRYEAIAYSYTDETLRVRTLKAAINDGMVVACAGWVYEWLRHVRGPLAGHREFRKNTDWTYLIGAHAMLIVGYDDDLGGFIVRNSWGEGWGDRGYYLMPYGDTSVFFEFWALRGFRSWTVNPGPYDRDCAEAKAGRLYRAALGRYPDAAGLAFQAEQVAHHGVAAVAANFMASPEFAARYGQQDAEGFVRMLYANVLGREPEPEGLQHHMASLAAGVSRVDLLCQFSESPEHKARA